MAGEGGGEAGAPGQVVGVAAVPGGDQVPAEGRYQQCQVQGRHLPLFSL